MLIRQKDQRVEVKEKLREGQGKVTFTHLVPAELKRHTKLFAELSLEPGASIGYHDHPADVEYFFILHGKGLVNDNGVEKPVTKGDVIVTGNGSFHGVKNTGTSTLDMLAIIIEL